MYNYYYVKTDCRSNTWDTPEIIEYLHSLNMFEEKNNGIFLCHNPFIDISLMKVKNINSWSSDDFDENETNYISIVTSDENEITKHFFKELERFLCFRICSDNLEREI